MLFTSDHDCMSILLQGGALLGGIYGPGFHLMVPFLTSHVTVQVFVITPPVNCVYGICGCGYRSLFKQMR